MFAAMPRLLALLLLCCALLGASAIPPPPPCAELNQPCGGGRTNGVCCFGLKCNRQSAQPTCKQ